MDGLTVMFTSSDVVNALKILIFSEKHPISKAHYCYTQKVAIDR